MLLIRKNGATSNVFRVNLRSSTTGQGLTGLAFNSSGLIISTICDNEATATAYTVAGSTIETVTTLGTFAAPTSNKCRFREVDATNHPGLYEIQLADARFAVASAKTLRVTISGASGLLSKDVLIQLTTADIADTANIAADIQTIKTQTVTAAAGVTFPTTISSFAGGAVASVTAGVTVTTNNDKTGYSLTAGTGLGNQTANITGSLSGSVGSVTGDVGGKVLGGGSGTITGTGVRADNRDGDAIPTAAQNAAAIDTATLATDIAAELQGSGVTYTVVSPVTSSSTLDVVQGMDYYTADGRDIEFTFVRDYVPTSCKLTLASGETVTVTSTDITESSGSGSGRFSVRFQLARTDGDDLDAGTGTFEVYSVVGTRHVPEIAEGVLTVRRRLSA